MIADEDERAAHPGHTGDLAVQRRQVGEVLVGERQGAEIVRLGGQRGGRDVRDAKRSIDVPLPGHLQHLRREIRTVEGRVRTASAEPGADAAGAARQVEHGAGRHPVDGPQPLEQPQIHLVLNGPLVRVGPLSIALADVDDGIAALVVRRVIHGRSSLPLSQQPRIVVDAVRPQRIAGALCAAAGIANDDDRVRGPGGGYDAERRPRESRHRLELAERAQHHLRRHRHPRDARTERAERVVHRVQDRAGGAGGAGLARALEAALGVGGRASRRARPRCRASPRPSAPGSRPWCR